MDEASIRTLIELNRRFYERHASSFSATRENGWPGWRKVMELAHGSGVRNARPLRILDAACGNLRFERFLVREQPGIPLDALCIDSNEELMRAGAQALEGNARERAQSPAGGTHRKARPPEGDTQQRVRTLDLDILETLLAGGKLPVPNSSFDLVACFGFLHHVPGEGLRRTLLRALVRTTRPGGIIALSFWQFMNDERLHAKVIRADAQAAAMRAPVSTPLPGTPAPGTATHLEAPPAPFHAGVTMPALEPGDHYLGWQGDAQVLRYCHHFSEEEIGALARAVAPEAREVARFSADGKTGALNRYLVLEKR